MQRRRSQGRAFTLVEMMLTLALVTLIFTMVATILVQLARYVRVGREVAQQRHIFLREIETFRYQIRSLHYPSSAVGLLGARTSLKGRDTLRFLTSRGRHHRGVVEVGYKIDSYVDPKDPSAGEKLGLFYREFPFRTRLMRELDEFTEAPWKLLLPNTDEFTLEYSVSGASWQRIWDGTIAPRVIRVRIHRSPPSKDRFAFDVTPGEGAARW